MLANRAISGTRSGGVIGYLRKSQRSAKVQDGLQIFCFVWEIEGRDTYWKVAEIRWMM
jgi:hypothetical protein